MTTAWATPTLLLSIIKILAILIRPSCPIGWQDAKPHILMKTGIGPIRHPLYQVMLHRVIVDVINMLLQVILIAYQVLPKSPLPYSFFALAEFARATPGVSRKGLRKRGLDALPARGKIAVIRRQFPQRMQMFGQNTNGDCFNGSGLHNSAIRPPQQSNLLDQ